MENNIENMINKSNQNKKTICFATMCKNEEHCIRDTLESVYKYIDYWVVHDTGSTDNTIQLVKDFFAEKNIPGELFEGEWVGFDHNKTQLFDRCYNKTDYILHLDADDIFHGIPDFSLLNKETADAYYFNCYRGVFYNVLLIFNNRHHWKFCGVAHTTIRDLDKENYSESRVFISESFYLLSRDTGSRSNDPEKYYKDALRLKDQFFNTLFDDPDNLNNRSVFYTAQSYMDSNKLEDAIKWYNLYLKLKNTWTEEQFESCIRIAKCLIRINPDDSFLIKKYIDMAINIFNDRCEPYYIYGQYCNQRHKWKEGYEYLVKTVNNDNYLDVKKKYHLFVEKSKYFPFNLDELSVSCYYLNKKDEGIDYINKIINCPEIANSKDRIIKNKHFLEGIQV
jgi:hypothetical protein|uniref:Glycosyltransferase 2-like domain-containing protein n=1 Tax=viral metagenome TaxID=1070528 RepID=A0A6C0CJ45_9ZZZZ